MGKEGVRGLSPDVLDLVAKVANYVLQGDDDLVPLGNLLLQTHQGSGGLEPLRFRRGRSNHSQPVR